MNYRGAKDIHTTHQCEGDDFTNHRSAESEVLLLAVLFVLTLSVLLSGNSLMQLG
jgi:hypothetical protein